jgi:hypothetical protein
MYSTVRIVCRTALATESVGTGFLIDGSLDRRQEVPLLVTNKHVIAGAIEGDLFFVAKDPATGGPLAGNGVKMTITDFARAWVGHPDPSTDVAVMPIAAVLEHLPAPAYYRLLTSEMMPSAEQEQHLDAIEELLFIGYPSGLHDQVNFTPLARTGISATPIDQPFSGQSVFLIDGSVFGGSSGSPVFIWNPNGYVQGGTFHLGAVRVMLVGIIASTMQRTLQQPLQTTTGPYVEIAEHLNLGMAFNWRAINEAIDALFSARGVSRS